jgi:WD40 repeat protein
LAVCGTASAPLVIYSTTNWAKIGQFSSSTPYNVCQFTFDNNLFTGIGNGSAVLFKTPFSTSLVTNASISFVNLGNNGGIKCLAYKWENLTTYYYLVGSDGLSSTTIFTAISNITNPNWNKVGCLTCTYSRTNDVFVFGGSDKTITFYNGTNNNNTKIIDFAFNDFVQASDFSNDGGFLAVGLANGSL